MKESIVDFIENNHVESGFIILLLGILLLINQLRKKYPLKFKGSSILEWNADFYAWILILMSFIFSFFLFQKS